MIMNRKRRMVVVVSLAMVLSCTGCTSLSAEAMRSQGEELLKQGQSLNRELAKSAEEMNSRILESLEIGSDGRKTIPEVTDPSKEMTEK